MTSLQTIATKIAACLCRELIDDWHMDVDARRQLVQIRRKQIDDVAINGNGDYILDQNGIKIEVDEEPRLVDDAVGISMWRGPSPAKRRVVGRGPNTGKRKGLTSSPYPSFFPGGAAVPNHHLGMPDEAIKVEDDSVWSDVKLACSTPVVSIPLIKLDPDLLTKSNGERGRKELVQQSASAVNADGPLINDLGEDEDHHGFEEDGVGPEDHGDLSAVGANVEAGDGGSLLPKRRKKKQILSAKRKRPTATRTGERKSKPNLMKGYAEVVEDDVKPTVDHDENDVDEGVGEAVEGAGVRRRRQARSRVSYAEDGGQDDPEDSDEEFWMKKDHANNKHLKDKVYDPKTPGAKRKYKKKPKDEEEDFVPSELQVS